jgi:hypothetical protein
MYFADGTIGQSPINIWMTKNLQNKADAGNSEISNDTGTYKALALVGNSSNANGRRNVTVYDDLNIPNGSINSKSMAISGASTTNGITNNGVFTNTGDITVNGTNSNINGVSFQGNSIVNSSKTNSVIANDTGTYQSLMLLGNMSKDGKTRKVNIYDDLMVNNNISAGGNIKIGDQYLAPGAVKDPWVRVLSDPNNTGSYSKGVAASSFWSSGDITANGSITANGIINTGNITNTGDITVNGTNSNINGVSFQGNSIVNSSKTNSVIANDTGTYQSLMLLGNMSKDGKTRKVNIYDDLMVNNNISAGGNIKIGDQYLAPADTWVRILSDPANVGSYSKGLAASKLYSVGNIYGGSINSGGDITTANSGNVVASGLMSAQRFCVGDICFCTKDYKAALCDGSGKYIRDI